MKKEFWITNISKFDVSLTDLNITIKSRKTVNLLDEKRYHLSEDQVEKSYESGSLFLKKKNFIKRVAPPLANLSIKMADLKAMMPTKERSAFSFKEERYEELEEYDKSQRELEEQFASDNADFAAIDNKLVK
jgi:hypothetical protein